MLFIFEMINISGAKTNQLRIQELNGFLKKDFDKVRLLFNNNNYYKLKKLVPH